MRITGMFLGARWVVGDDGDRALVSDSLAEVVSIVGGIGHNHLGRRAFDQGPGLWRIAHLTGREREADRTPKAPHRHVNLGAQAAA